MKAHAINFQSFEDIEFDYADLGLALVSGPTGFGKSTLLDIPVWGLFGTTSKDTGADDVLAWGADGPTSVVLEVPVPEGKIVVTRIRGKSTQNDLFWHEYDSLGRGSSVPIRGKDMRETQALLEKRVGYTAETFLTVAYMSQFLDGGRFFTAKAKERREITDKIADLSVPTKLAERASEVRKETKKLLDAKEKATAQSRGVALQIAETIGNTMRRENEWTEKHAVKLKELRSKSDNFKADREAQMGKLVSQLEELDPMIRDVAEYDAREKSIVSQLKTIAGVKTQAKNIDAGIRLDEMVVASLEGQYRKLCSIKGDQCPTCLGPAKNPNMTAELQRLEKEKHLKLELIAPRKSELKGLNDALALEDKLRKDSDKVARDRRENDVLIARFTDIQAKAIVLRDSVNHYEEKLETARKDTNPYSGQVEEYEADLRKAQQTVVTGETEIAKITHRIASLTWLYDKSFALRGMMLSKAVNGLNKRMNDILERHFDASLRVKMILGDADDLEVEINNSGYPCKFGQLSGGERAQLKLAFGIAYREAAQNKIGRKFEVAMFDEALNGMDNDLKVKAFGAFQEVAKEHSTVLLVDHSEELKSHFETQFRVDKHGSSSHLVKINAGV